MVWLDEPFPSVHNVISSLFNRTIEPQQNKEEAPCLN